MNAGLKMFLKMLDLTLDRVRIQKYDKLAVDRQIARNKDERVKTNIVFVWFR